MQANTDYKTLRIYAYYRAFLGSLLLLMFSAGIGHEIFGNHQPTLFFRTSLIYTLLNLLTLVLLWLSHFSPRPPQVLTLLLIDVMALLILMQASGGINSGLGYLLLICMAAGAIFLHRQISVALASLTCIAVIGLTLLSVLHGNGDNRSLFTAGTLGILLFLTSLGFSYLTGRIRDSNLEVEYQKEQAANLERLAQSIVERMRTGVVVMTPAGTIDMANQAASRLLQTSQEQITQNQQIAAQLHQSYLDWKQQPSHKPLINLNSHEVRLGFAELENDGNGSTLIFLEDIRTLNQEAQQLKLASLGRLTASIAHEIRNPLGAISHASQLLAESPELTGPDRRMTEIIEANTQRVNQIIENVLQLSRRRAAEPASLELNQWLQQFVNEFHHDTLSEFQLRLHCADSPLPTHFDRSHMQQVLTNLCNNGLRYSHSSCGEAVVDLESAIDPASDCPCIRVIDRGPGISDDNVRHLFEPFFTTEATGSGLGLYLSKELCQANQATLRYYRTEDMRSCFQINLPHPQRSLNP